MDKLLKHMSFQGRAGRLRYWVTWFASMGVLIVCALLSGIPLVGIVVAGVGFLGVIAVNLAVAVRRLHDRAKSGWWLVAMYVPATVLSGLSTALETSAPDAAGGLALLSLPFSLWALVELGGLKGTSGPNRFGPDPLKPSPAEVFS